VLLVAKPDRLARRATDLLALRDRAEREGWTLTSADGSLDMSTPHGRAMSTVMGAFAELERDLIRNRTREGLAAKRAQGVRLGRPSQVPADVRDRIASQRSAGHSLARIADALTGDGVPTVGNGNARTARRGARWYPSTVRAVLRTIELDRTSADIRRGRFAAQAVPPEEGTTP
jgi:DNA invertase Pin-like site-specific DNA recombinase